MSMIETMLNGCFYSD